MLLSVPFILVLSKYGNRRVGIIFHWKVDEFEEERTGAHKKCNRPILIFSTETHQKMLTTGLLTKTDPEVSIKCLFQLCDSDHDGFLTLIEMTNLLSILFTMNNDNQATAEIDEHGEKCRW